MCTLTQGQGSIAHHQQTEVFCSSPFPEPLLKFKRMRLNLVPRLSLCSSDIVVPGVALRRLLLHSFFDFFHGSNFIPKRATRHRAVEEGTLPPISKPRRRHHHQEQTAALQLCVQAVQVNSGPLCGDRPLTAEAEKKWPKLKKKLLPTRSTKLIDLMLATSGRHGAASKIVEKCTLEAAEKKC